jgi:hypothetical protein
VTPFERALAAFTQIHEGDPRRIATDGGSIAFSVRYHDRLAHWVRELAPEASVALSLAAHAQHLGRYAFPRETFPPDNAGYKRWRATLARKHAEDASKLVRDAGFDEATAVRVVELVTKKRLLTDPEVGLFEDAICLTFLELDLEPFLAKTDRAKAIDVIKKTWAKMGVAGRERAPGVLATLAAATQAVVAEALAASS